MMTTTIIIIATITSNTICSQLARDFLLSFISILLLSLDGCQQAHAKRLQAPGCPVDGESVPFPFAVKNRHCSSRLGHFPSNSSSKSDINKLRRSAARHLVMWQEAIYGSSEAAISPISTCSHIWPHYIATLFVICDGRESYGAWRAGLCWLHWLYCLRKLHPAGSLFATRPNQRRPSRFSHFHDDLFPLQLHRHPLRDTSEDMTHPCRRPGSPPFFTDVFSVFHHWVRFENELGGSGRNMGYPYPILCYSSFSSCHTGERNRVVKLAGVISPGA